MALSRDNARKDAPQKWGKYVEKGSGTDFSYINLCQIYIKWSS